VKSPAEAARASLRAVGTVVPDERRLHRAQTRVAGWVEKLHVNFSGQSVRRGQPMLSIYSPELLASQQEYLIARDNARRFLGSTLPEVRRGGEDLVAAARRRLELFDVPESFIAELERTGQPRRTVDLVAPASGYVVSKEVLEGRQVEPGMELFTVADLSHVWVEGEFYESEARLLAPGQEATLRLAYDPGRTFAARIDYIYPELDPATRTLRVRYDLANPDLALKPGMFVDVEQRLEVGEGVVVSDLAVLDSGVRQIVFVESAPGRFEPRQVSVVWRGEGRALLAPGAVAEGEKVAVKANFLLDSESRLAAALAALGADKGAQAPVAAPPGHAGHGAEGDQP
ncbi:MAG: efflux RND transporter periplasmic adaptor subunit, partial [Thermoanaerobaculia bacterium]